MNMTTEPKSDTELVDAAFFKWSDAELEAGREPNASRFAREVLIREPRQLRRWRAGTSELPEMMRDFLRRYLGLEVEEKEQVASGNR